MTKRITASIVLILVAGGILYVTLGRDSTHPAPTPLSSDESSPSFNTVSSSTDTVTRIDDATVTRVSHSSVTTSNERNIGYQDTSTAKTVQINGTKYPIRRYKPLALPNDPYASQAWVEQAAIQSVWDEPRPSVDTTLAIIDTGFALSHEEFSGRWYRSTGETGSTTSEAPSRLNCTDQGLAVDMSCNLIDEDRDMIVDNEIGATAQENPSWLNCTDQARPLTRECNRIDDDNNGYVDDVTGWDFMNFDHSVQAGEINPTGTGTTHGTLVAGVAAANGNNGRGVAGVDWGTKILPIQALDDDSYGDTLSVGDAIYYAVEKNVDVISISLGSELPDDYVRGALQAALKKGIVVVAASGNDGCDCIVYPANYPETLAVGALNASNVPADFSSWGGNLDIMAPGTQFTSPTWSATNRTSAYASGVNGTSFSTPLVAGLLTRMVAQQPTATPQQLIAAAMETTNRLTLSSTASRSNTLGYGSIAGGAALQRMNIPSNSKMLYAYSGIEKGSYLTSSDPVEPNGAYRTYKCANRPGATPIYELIKSSQRFFTISEVERYQAIRQGYASSLLAYACVQQPHDAPTTIRNLNVFAEFRNSTSKRR